MVDEDLLNCNRHHLSRTIGQDILLTTGHMAFMQYGVLLGQNHRDHMSHPSYIKCSTSLPIFVQRCSEWMKT